MMMAESPPLIQEESRRVESLRTQGDSSVLPAPPHFLSSPPISSSSSTSNFPFLLPLISDTLHAASIVQIFHLWLLPRITIFCVFQSSFFHSTPDRFFATDQSVESSKFPTSDSSTPRRSFYQLG